LVVLSIVAMAVGVIQLARSAGAAEEELRRGEREAAV
jgi:hypothetical protein